MFNIIKLNEKDNIGIAPMDIPQNININYGIKSINNIPYGHKISLKKIKSGDFIFKYGQIIGISNKNIEPGEHVHSHNMGYSEFKREYIRKDIRNDINKSEKTEYFKGFKRNNGSSGTRNYIGLISTVNCSATVVKKISDKINRDLIENFGSFAIPKKIFFVNELPKTRSGKILRRLLREILINKDKN